MGLDVAAGRRAWLRAHPLPIELARSFDELARSFDD
jgi:hypothetical protein